MSENEPLIEIETDKVTVEVAAPGSGVLSEILKQEQEEIAPGELLGRIAADTAPASHVPQAAATPTTPAPAAASPAARAPAGGGALSPAVRRLLAAHALEAAQVSGSGPGGRIMVEDVLKAAAGAAGGTARTGAARRRRPRACGACRTRRCGAASPSTWCRACCTPHRT